MSQEALFTNTADAVLIAQLRKNMRRLLSEVGSMNFCRLNPTTGQGGCGREIYWVNIKGGKTRKLDEDGSGHVCPKDIKP